MNIYYQEGGQEMGQEEQLMQLFQAFADIVQDDEFNTAEEVMQMFMELAPEEQQAFVQQAIQIIQQEQGEPELESNPEEELMEQQEVQPMMQQGGINPQKIQQILQAYASSIGEDPNVILQQFQQMQPEEQQQALQQIVQQLQGGGEEQMQMQEQQQMQDGGYVNNTGYLEGYESSNNPYNIIPSNRITMEGVRPDIQYIKGTDNLGNTQYMEHGGEYKFDGDFVVEEPVYAQTGEDLQDSYQYKQQRGEVIKKLLKNPNISSSERSILTTELVKNAKDLKQIETKIQNVPKINETKLNEIKQAKKAQAAKKAIEQTTAERIARNKGVSNIPLTEQQAIAADDAFNLAKKETPLPFYERMRQAKIDKGISTGTIKPVPNVNLSIGNIGEVALQKLSNGSTEVLNQLKKLKIQNPNIKIADLKKYVPKVNSITVKNIEDGLIGGGRSILSAGKTIAKGVGTALPYVGIATTLDQISDLNEKEERGAFEDQFNYKTQKALGQGYTSDDAMGTFLGINFGGKEEDKTSEKYLKNKARYDALMQQKNITKNDKNQTPKIVVKGDSTGKPIEMTELSTEKGKYIGSDGNEWLSTDGGKNFKIVKKQTTSANQDKPKIKLPDKRTKAALAERKTPSVITPPPAPTAISEQQDTFDYRQPFTIDPQYDEYVIPEEDRKINFTPLQGANYRPHIGVGKRFFNQTGGYNYAQDGFKPRKFKSELDFNSRLNPGSSMNMGAKSDGDFEYAYPDKKKVYYVNGAAQLDPINQYDKMPMGANSVNYEAPNAESMKMWNRGSDRLLDLANYADRYGVEHFGANTKPISNQNVDRRSKFQQFMDKYGKKADMQFDPVPFQVAPMYNLMKASEPLASQFRGQMDVRYAEKPMVDPRPFIQELQNQYMLSSRNVNSNSPTGMAWESNLQAKLKAGIEDISNKTNATNQQIAAENELSRINAFNQEQQANNTYNQQYVQSMLQAQAAKDLAMGESLSSLDQLRANAVKARNNFKSLAVMTPGLKPVENFNTLLTGSQGFNIDKDFQQLVSTVTQAKTPEEVAAAQKIYSDALKKKQAAAKAATETKQIGGKINDFFRKRY